MLHLAMLSLALLAAPAITTIGSLSRSSPLGCIHIIAGTESHHHHTLFKTSNKFININRNETWLEARLPGSPSCLVYVVNPAPATQAWLSGTKHHMIVIAGSVCKDLLPSQFNVNMYCITEDIVYEKYSIRSTTVFQEAGDLRTDHPREIYSQKLQRRGDLQGVELTVTTLEFDKAIIDANYGPSETASVTGYFGDLFMILQERMNFTFNLYMPKDNKWGGKEKGRKFGWNGMIGDIVEGVSDFGIGPFTSTPQRNEVVRFSIGNLDIVKTFFIKRSKADALNLTLFIAPFTIMTWLAVLFLILCVGLILFIIIHSVNDKQTIHFNLRRSLTFSFSGVTFIRRWSVTPTSVSARIVFILVLYVGIIVQGMWKASFTSVLAVEKEVVLYEDLEDLLKAGMTIAVEESSAQEGNFR